MIRIFVAARPPLARGQDATGAFSPASRVARFRLPPRLHPRLRPRQARARGLPIAARLRPGLAGREAPVPLDLSRARREERAEDADRTVVEAGRRVEHEGLAAIVPGQADPGGSR